MTVTEARKALKGLKSWWNKNCKPRYRISISVKELENECLSEMMNTGSVEMSRMFSKSGHSENYIK